MRSFRKDLQGGAVSGYAVGLLILGLILVGGVMWLKNFSSDKAVNTDDTVILQDESEPSESDTSAEGTATSEQTSSGAADDSGRPGNNASSGSTQVTATGASDSIVTTGAQSEGYVGSPENMAQTGPSEVISEVFGVLLILGAGYASWHYYLSRRKLEQKLLEK